MLEAGQRLEEGTLVCSVQILLKRETDPALHTAYFKKFFFWGGRRGLDRVKPYFFFLRTQVEQMPVYCQFQKKKSAFLRQRRM